MTQIIKIIVSLKGSLQELSNEYLYYMVLITAKLFHHFHIPLLVMEVASSPKSGKDWL
jgi:hypothetical protein